MYKKLIFIGIFCLLMPKNLENITLKEKIAQMIMVRIDGNFHNSEDWTKKNLEILIKDRKVGGIIIFGGDVHGAVYNINELQTMSEVPLFVAADYERGLGQWIGGTLFPTNMALAATGNIDYAYEQGRITAIEASSIGVNMVFAPVLDINDNPDNPIINFRSYSDDVNIVSDFGISFINGIQDNGLIACSKHYPGHGDTNIDSHSSLPIINKSENELFNNEFLPFKRACKAGVKSIMVGHIVLPQIDDSLKPASHSYKITHNILRNTWNYDGLIITDALEMSALNSTAWEGESAIRAVEAGADIVLLPRNTTRAINAIYEAVLSGRISEERIDYSYNKIIEEKKNLGLFNSNESNWDDVLNNVGLFENKSIASKIAKESITIVKDENNLIPINPSKYKKVTHILLSVDEDVKSKLNYFTKQIKYTHGNVQEIIVNDKLTNKGIEDVLDKIKDSDLVIVSMLIRIKMDKGQSTIDDSHNELLSEIKKLNIPSVSVSFGSPYLPDYNNVSTYVCTYGYGSVTLKAVTNAIFGRVSITGKLPVNLNESYKRGTGIEYIFKSSLPENLNRLDFSKSWDILETAINDSVFPGCQVVVLYQDTIIAKKAIGHLSYDLNKKVDLSTLYDVASLTKVLTTTPIIMKLIQQKKIDLSIPISQFYNNLDSSKINITIYDLLTHSAGFKPYIEYYRYSNVQNRASMISDILAQPLNYTTGTDVVYSDLGLILLLDIIEKISSQSLDILANKWFYSPLGMNSTVFNPSFHDNIAPTENDNYFRNKLLVGEVHDENAYILGGISTHAGLFSNALDIAKLASMFINSGIYNGKRYLDSDLIRKFSMQQFTNFNSDRAIGWDTPSRNGTSSAGDYFSNETYGHLGFTGTSLWIDPKNEIVVILLTNRVHPSRKRGGMYSVRRSFHTEIMKTFIDKGLI